MINLKRSLKIIAAILVSLWLGMAGSAHVFATNQDDYDAAVYDYVYYDPSDYDTCQIAAGTGGTSLEGNTNAEKAFSFFVSQGLTPKQAAGIIGNLMQESGVNPAIKQGGGGPGRGIAQWSVGDRWDHATFNGKPANVVDFAAGLKLSATSLEAQLQFIMFEGQTVPPWNKWISAVKATTSIQAAVMAFEENYEKAGKPNFPARIGYANDAYNKFASKYPTPGTPTTPGATPEPAGDVAGCGAAGGGNGSIVAIAQAELAKNVLEQPIGCDAGNRSVAGSCGAEVDKYTDKHLEYWCADFVSWVYKQAGKPFTGGSSGGWRIASVEGVMAWFKARGKFTANGPSANPKPGDVYIIENGTHTGIVEKVVGNDLYTISGNTSTDNYSNGVGVGDRVYKNFRSDSRITGFGGL